MSTSQTDVLATDAISDGPWPRWRVLLIRIWAGLLTLVMLMMAQGVVVAAGVGEDLHFAAATSTVFKLLSLGGVVWVLLSGGRSVSGYWMILVGQLSWAVSAMLAPPVDGNAPLQQLANGLILYGPLVALRPRRRELLHLRVQPRALTTVLAAVGSCGVIAFASHLASGSSSNAELVFDAVGLYLTLALMSLFAAARPAGGRWLIPAVVVGIVVTAAFAIAFPADMASPGRLGAAVLLLWALAFAGAAWFESTRAHMPIGD